MSWSMSTACRSLKLATVLFSSLFVLVLSSWSQDVNLRVPSDAVAGQATSIATSGSGSATFYLVGPAIALKHEVQLGQAVPLTANDVKIAGRYVATVCSSGCSSATFFVSPARPADLAFLVHPSRAPVSESDVISGVAFSFDEFGNLVFAPATINFQLSAAKGVAPIEHSVQTQHGAAWFRTNSGKSAEPLHVTASLGAVKATRVVQEVASEPCNLRIKGERTAKGIMVETEPVRDCSGNPVPDGTIVTFTAKSGDQTSTVDAPIKQDVARARITTEVPAVVSAASGVVMGNELKVGGQ